MAERIKHLRPRLRPLASYNKTWLGFVGLSLAVVLIGALLLVKQAGIGYRRYTAEFLQAASLQPDNVVSVAGVPVGNVISVRLAGDHVEARLRVKDNIALGRDTRAAIKITTIFGSRYIDLHPTGAGVPPGQTIDLAHTEVPYDLQAALADSTRTFEQVDGDRIASSLTVLGQALNGLPDVFPQALENVRALSSVISQRRDQLGTLLKSTQNVTDILRRQQSDLGSMIRQGQDLIGEFVAHSAAFHAMMQALTQVVGSLRTIVVDDRAALEDVVQTMEQLSAKLAEQDALFRNLLEIAPVPVRELANASGYGNALELNAAAGPLVDSWMCAISGRAKQFGLIQYFKDCA
ncbi:MCE family protein [Mycobacterium marinum]|uniref:MCE-family protein Mce6C n=2 Tax=Mycobacterium marinum TaxID=1781 RepID=B2HJI0_MYCMM|nr:MlaD family protein [Mycobacterium marinum]ACC38649.1 MCE-family protein Mce6C [Mycobacterium marinum M]AXN42125.1 mce related protein [Mycobacterium marinum]AXN47593.1 mce related protein [Mycobacterium marinum]EPQ70945.1 MCE-family protein [Mycobacterium marinum MB2]EPQ72439.1 MCE-family protein Mce6C [Mycobacterium marinum str. Europe]